MSSRAVRKQAVEFVEIDPKGKSTQQLLAEIARAVGETHRCIHVGQEAQARRDAEADAKREALATQVSTIATAVGVLQTDQAMMNGRVNKLATIFGADQEEPPPPVLKGELTWKEIGKIAAAVFGSISGVVLLYRIAVPVFEALHKALLSAS